MTVWHDISTAPKGREILIIGDDGMFVGSWLKPNGYNPLVSMLAGEDGGYWCAKGSAFPIRGAARWRRLPPSPPQ